MWGGVVLTTTITAKCVSSVYGTPYQKTLKLHMLMNRIFALGTLTCFGLDPTDKIIIDALNITSLVSS